MSELAPGLIEILKAINEADKLLRSPPGDALQHTLLYQKGYIEYSREYGYRITPKGREYLTPAP